MSVITIVLEVPGPVEKGYRHYKGSPTDITICRNSDGIEENNIPENEIKVKNGGMGN